MQYIGTKDQYMLPWVKHALNANSNTYLESSN